MCKATTEIKATLGRAYQERSLGSTFVLGNQTWVNAI